MDSMFYPSTRIKALIVILLMFVIFMGISACRKYNKDDGIPSPTPGTSEKESGRKVKGESEVENQPMMFHVDNGKGSNTESGTLEKPFKSIEQARDAVRNILQEIRVGSRIYEGEIVVVVHEGIYGTASTLTFGSQDSAPEGVKVIYRPALGEKVILDTSLPLTNWEPYQDGIFVTSLAAVPGSADLYFDGESRGIKARYPNDGYLHGKGNNPGSRGEVQFFHGDIPEGIEEERDLQIDMWDGGPDGYWAWWNHILPITRIDYTNHQIVLRKPLGTEPGLGTRFFLQGSLKFLDQPLEYHVDTAKKKIYFHPGSRDISKMDVRMSTTKRIVEFKGTPASPVRGITLEGFEIRNTRFDPSEWDGAIAMENASEICIRSCRIYNTGSHAIYLKTGVQGVRIQGNEVFNVGSTGVMAFGGWRSKECRNKGNVVRSNYIHDTGQILGDGSGVQLINSAANTISHNRIDRTSRYSINVMGVRRDELIGTNIEGIEVTEENMMDFSHSRDNIIEYNDCSNAIMDSQDGAPINAYYSGRGNIVRYNRIHHTTVPFTFGFGFYLDAGSDGWLVEGNLIDNLQNSGDNGVMWTAMMTKGDDNIYRNNIIADNHVMNGVTSSIRDDNASNRNLVLERNIYFNNGNGIYQFQNWEDDRYQLSDYNTLYNDSGQYNIVGCKYAEDFASWREILEGRFDRHSLIANPQFVNSAAGDYRLAYSSPVYIQGFEDRIDYGKIGLTEEYLFQEEQDPLSSLFLFTGRTHTGQGWVNLKTGEKDKIGLLCRTEQGSIADLSEVKVHFITADPSIAQVDGKGRLQAISPGITRVDVTVKKQDVVLSKPVFVIVDDPFDRLTLRMVDPAVIVGQRNMLAVGMASCHGKIKALPRNTEVIFRCSDSSIGEVLPDGLFVPYADGEVEITAEAVIDGQPMSGSIQITVSKQKLFSVEIGEKGILLKKGDVYELNPVLNMKDGSSSSAFDIPEAKLSFESLSPQIAAVNQNGQVEGLEFGRAVIRVKAELQGIVRTAQMTAIVQEGNLALNQHVRSSGGRGTEKVVDGLSQYEDPSSLWVSESAPKGQWISIDLGTSKNIHEIHIGYETESGYSLWWPGFNWSSRYYVHIPKSITVEVSEDGMLWEKVIRQSSNVPVPISLANFEDNYCYSMNQKGRFIRLFFEEGAAVVKLGHARNFADDFIGISEISIY